MPTPQKFATWNSLELVPRFNLGTRKQEALPQLLLVQDFRNVTCWNSLELVPRFNLGKRKQEALPQLLLVQDLRNVTCWNSLELVPRFNLGTRKQEALPQLLLVQDFRKTKIRRFIIMSNETATQLDRLMAKCVEVASTVLTDQEAIIQIRRCEPTFGRNYTNHYKAYLATLDPTGVNPINQRCVVVSITSNMDSALVDPYLSCDSVKELD